MMRATSNRRSGYRQRFLMFCPECGAPSTGGYAGSPFCGSGGRSCERPVALTAEDLQRDQAQLELEASLRWEAFGVNIGAGRGELLEENGSATGRV